MPRLHVDLQEGFADDPVVVWVDDREAFRSAHVTTRRMLGLAESFEVEVPHRDVTVRAEVPSRPASVAQRVSPAHSPYVGLSLVEARLTVQLSATPFAYL